MARFLATCLAPTTNTPNLIICGGTKAGDQVISVVNLVPGGGLGDNLLSAFGSFIPADDTIGWLGITIIPGVPLGQPCLVMVERPGT